MEKERRKEERKKIKLEKELKKKEDEEKQRKADESQYLPPHSNKTISYIEEIYSSVDK